MEFENQAQKISSVNDCDYFEKSPTDTKQTARLSVIDGEMQQETVTKTKFSQFNDKRFYFSDGITSLSFSDSYLKDLNEHKERKKIFGKKEINYLQWKTRHSC